MIADAEFPDPERIPERIPERRYIELRCGCGTSTLVNYLDDAARFECSNCNRQFPEFAAAYEPKRCRAALAKAKELMPLPSEGFDKMF